MAFRREFKDYYRILKIPPSAPDDEVRSAYRRLARNIHPDLVGLTDFERARKLVNEAYSVLGDPRKRSTYDLLHYSQRPVTWSRPVPPSHPARVPRHEYRVPDSRQQIGPGVIPAVGAGAGICGGGYILMMMVLMGGEAVYSLLQAAGGGITAGIGRPGS